MNSDLTLKFKSETGTAGMFENAQTSDGENITVPTDSYLEWLEDLALKQIKGSKSIFEAQKIMKKMSSIEVCFESLKSSISYIDSSDVEAYEIDQIKDDCDNLESVIYD